MISTVHQWTMILKPFSLMDNETPMFVGEQLEIWRNIFDEIVALNTSACCLTGEVVFLLFCIWISRGLDDIHKNREIVLFPAEIVHPT